MTDDPQHAEIWQEAHAVLQDLRQRLLQQRHTDDNHWQGCLAGSALSTAVAAFALSQVDAAAYAEASERAAGWLCKQQNQDGGWGDTTISGSNLSTTLLCWSALSYFHRCPNMPTVSNLAATLEHANAWLRQRLGEITADRIAAAVSEFYGNDRTFSAPILTMCVLAGVFAENRSVWKNVPQLPFELALIPQRLYRLLRLPVVSYAIPALVAVGAVRHHHCPTRLPLLRQFRTRLIKPAISLLLRLQPRSGGFLEAAPLTGFVAMCLARADNGRHPVVQKAAEFLINNQRPDGSWPIDSDLAIWVTTLSVKALSAGAMGLSDLTPGLCGDIQRWLLEQQYRHRHPYSGAAPGGWGWTDRSGAVPDADDTAGALLALSKLSRHVGSEPDTQIITAVEDGLAWLCSLRNRDGGVPTFCRGWGKLPFDRSCPDLTAHALRACMAWESQVKPQLQKKLCRFKHHALQYLISAQQPDGAWIPLWFGNETAPRQENRTYGTALVVRALQELRKTETATALEKGEAWLMAAQNADGGWGAAGRTASTIEETALALNALAGAAAVNSAVLTRGVKWLLANIRGQDPLPAAPIGLYFASLWYWERLYPLVFATQALGRVLQRQRGSEPDI